MMYHLVIQSDDPEVSYRKDGDSEFRVTMQSPFNVAPNADVIYPDSVLLIIVHRRPDGVTTRDERYNFTRTEFIDAYGARLYNDEDYDTHTLHLHLERP